ncbi:MAG: hypothetical protein ACP5HU_03560 [Phycisphaerae bacterium]
MNYSPSENFLIIGELPREYLSQTCITEDLGVVARKLDLAGRQVSVEELDRACESADDDTVHEIAWKLIAGAEYRRSDQPADEHILDAIRMYLGLQSLVREYSAAAVTVVCDQWKQRSDRPVPCVPLMLLGEQGVPGGCQGDIDALLTMVMYRRWCGRCSFMGGLHEHTGRAVVSHDVLPRNFADANAAGFAPYTIADYHGELAGPTVHVKLAPGLTVTLAHVTKDLQTLILSRGTLLEVADSPIRCRNAMVIDTPSLDALMSLRIDNQYHFAVAAGDCTQQMAAGAREAGVEPKVV